MKKLLVVCLVVFLFSGAVLGQEKKERPEWLEEFGLYAGWLYGANTKDESFLNTRMGIRTSLIISDVLSVQGYTVWYTDEPWEDASNLNGFVMTYESGDTRICVGKTPTVTTLQRPHPVSSGGQFEVEGHGFMPGSAYGVLAQHGSFLVSVTERNESGAEVHLGYSSDPFKIAVWHGPDTQGVAMTTKAGRLQTVNAWSQDVVANTILLDVGYGFTAYSDGGFNYELDQLTKIEVGFLKEVELTKGLKLLFAVGNRLNNDEWRVYGWLHAIRF